jgi:WD40 repeat protein
MDDGYWLTAADDGTIALWDPSSLCAIRSICYRKERVTALLVDEANMLLLVSMQSDYAIRAYRLDLVGEEVCAYTGHTEQVHMLAYLGNRKQYLSGSWDNSIRIWFAPASGPGDVVMQEKRLSNGVDEKKLKSTKEAEFAEEARYVSEYEREHPLVMPKQLQDMKASIPPDKALKQSSTGSSAGKAGDPVRLPSLVFKLASLERTLNKRIA